MIDGQLKAVSCNPEYKQLVSGPLASQREFSHHVKSWAEHTICLFTILYISLRIRPPLTATSIAANVLSSLVIWAPF
jgi:hypothetical protein